MAKWANNHFRKTRKSYEFIAAAQKTIAATSETQNSTLKKAGDSLV